MPLTKVGPKYQVTIPKEAREALRIKVGDLVEATVEEQTVVLRPKVVLDRAPLERARSLPIYTPTRRELREIEQGREAMRRGKYYTLDEFSEWLLGRSGKKARPKRPPARPKA